MERIVRSVRKRSRIIAYFPANTFHSNVSAFHRKVYLETFAKTGGPLDILRNGGVEQEGGKPIKVSMSLQGIDLALLGMTPDDFAGIELIDAPWAHFLPSCVAGAQHLDDHAKWQVAHGVLRGSAAYFVPEFCIPRQPWLLPKRQYLLPAVGSATVLYSECLDGDLTVGGKLEQYDALKYNGNVAVPMKGVESLSRAFFTYQRFPTQENLDSVVLAASALIEDGKGQTYIWFPDLEAPLVGSVEKDFGILDRVLKALVRAGLSDDFVTFADAQDDLLAKAVEPNEHGLLSRQTGLKWTKWDSQLEHIRRYGTLRAPKSDREHAIMSLVTGSDVLSAMCSKIDGPIVIDAHSGNKVHIGYDPTMITVGAVALKCYRERDLELRAFDDLVSIDRNDPIPAEGKWFARKVAEMIRKMAA